MRQRMATAKKKQEERADQMDSDNEDETENVTGHEDAVMNDHGGRLCMNLLV